MIVLIADDERLVRFAMKSMLMQFMEDSEDIFLEAVNGKEMVEVCRTHQPDVVLADISMPYMDGLEAIFECKKYSPETQYVIVTGFSEFEYAKRAIHLGVNDYLLKPVDSEKLQTVMEKIRQNIGEKKQESNSRFQLQVMEAFNYFASLGESENLKIETGQWDYFVYFIYEKEHPFAKTEDTDFQKMLLKEIRNLGEELVKRKGHYVTMHTPEGTICVIFEVSQEQKEHILFHMNRICFTIRNQYKNRCYIRWSKCKKLQEAYQESVAADAEVYLLLDRQPGILYQKHELVRPKYEKQFLIQIEKLLEAWKKADGIACKDIINKIWRTYRENEPKVDLKMLSAYCNETIGCPISHESFKRFFQSFVEHSEKMYCGYAKEERDITENTKQYILKNYMYDISISQIAEQLGLTANYLSTIFKRKTGEKFIDYLTRTRMEAAKKLLVQNFSASVQDIALMVGYNSARHFSALFQKYTGETPSAYRKSQM